MRATWMAVALAACAGDKDTDDTGTDTSGAPTFSEVRDEVLLPSCALSTCHDAGTVNGMELAPGAEYTALVNATSIAAPGEILIIPSDSENSYVIRKILDNDGIVGAPMPYPFGDLDPAMTQRLRDWIDAGALDN